MLSAGRRHNRDRGRRSPRYATLTRSLVVTTRFELLAERYGLLGSGVADQAVARLLCGQDDGEVVRSMTSTMTWAHASQIHGAIF